MKRIPLPQWAAQHYSPPPSRWVLRKWAREGEIFPPPERVGRDWYVREDARRQTEARPSLVEVLAPQEPEPAKKPALSYDQTPYIYSLAEAAAGCHEFYDPRDVACGVYLVLNKEKTKCMYVGSSVRLADRLRNGGHAPWDQPTFSFEVPVHLVRDVEATYWHALEPAVNQMSPSGFADSAVAERIRSLWK